MITKTRKQGNSIMLTVPKEFDVPNGVEVEAKLVENGILYEFVEPKKEFFDFRIDVSVRINTEGVSCGLSVLRNFQEEIGHPIARVDKYSVNFYKTEEEYLKDLLNKQNREHYDMFPQVYDDTKNNEVYDF